MKISRIDKNQHFIFQLMPFRSKLLNNFNTSMTYSTCEKKELANRSGSLHTFDKVEK